MSKYNINSNILKLTKGHDFKVVEVESLDKVSVLRLDVIIKFLYVKLYSGKGVSAFKDLYLDHINCINGFVENDDDIKIGRDGFVKSFNDLISSFERSNFSEDEFAIPVNVNGEILDGAHRLACYLYFSPKLVTSLEYGGIDNQHCYDYQFFLDRGIDKKLIETVVHEYCRLKDNVISLVVWPNSSEHVLDILDSMVAGNSLLYKKSISFSKNGIINFVKEVYSSESWVGSFDDGFIGVENKARWCFGSGGDLHVLFLEVIDFERFQNTKEELRKSLGSSKHSMHSTDNKDETLEVCELVLNENSIHRIEHSLRVPHINFQDNFCEFKNLVEKFGSQESSVILGSVFSVYGVKDSLDIDYASLDDMDFERPSIEYDQEKINVLGKSVSDLVFLPCNYFYFNRIKFISVENVKLIRERRGRDQDKLDLKLIERMAKGGFDGARSVEWGNLLTVSWYKIQVKKNIYKLRYFYIVILRRIREMVA